MGEDADDRERTNDEPVLGPDELDIADDEHVRVIGDNRYVISADEPIGIGEPTDDAPADEDEPAANARESAIDSGSVHEWLADRLASADARYGFDITARFDDTIADHRLRADDVVTVFDALMYWYASHLDDEMPIEEALGILLMESNIRIRYPTDTVYGLVRAHDLDADDSIGDLLDALRGDGRIQFPPSERGD